MSKREPIRPIHPKKKLERYRKKKVPDRLMLNADSTEQEVLE